MKVKKLVTFSIITTMVSISNAQDYRDLNKNGKMDDYENKNLSVEVRAKDLLSQMAIAEKVGVMFHTYSGLTKEGDIDKEASMTGGLTTDKLIVNNHMNHFNLVGDAPAISIAKYNNKIQKIAESTRLGIPVTFSTDLRSSYKTSDMSTTLSAGDFTAFPEPLGMAATRDTYAINKAARVMASEYKAVGISMLLNPIGDLATEPRWARISGTFGEDAILASNMLVSYLNGFQGDQITSTSIACITKHFPGNGPQEEGWDGHFNYGRWLVYPGGNFDYHIKPFKAAIDAGTVGMMTCYGIPKGITKEQIGSSFDEEIMTQLLKNKLGFQGILVSDWNTVTDKYVNGERFIEARGWGVENVTLEEKLIKLIKAGVDQIGGETATRQLEELVRQGKISEKLIDASVLKIITLKFQLGLFDNPYVDETKVYQKVGIPENKKIGKEIQQKSLILLENKNSTYPLKKGMKIYIEGYKNKQKFSKYGQIVNDIKDCDFAIIRLTTPYGSPRTSSMVEKYFHQGSLAFTKENQETILTKLKSKPSVVILNLERAAVIPEIAKYSQILFAEFGISEEALLPILYGEVTPQGKLPIELPSSMEAVKKQKEDLSYDSENPLYKFGFGLE